VGRFPSDRAEVVEPNGGPIAGGPRRTGGAQGGRPRSGTRQFTL